jgi:quercetin dioxygenase-like cupin family protein
MKLNHINNLPEVGVSHNPEIKKKIMVDKGYIPNLTTFAQATFKPGQSVEMHTHETMFEVFYIEKGKAEFVVEDSKMILEPGDSITIEPGEKHSQSNPFNEDVTWLYFGVAVP